MGPQASLGGWERPPGGPDFTLVLVGLLALPCGSLGELPQPRRMTTGAKASLPSTQCLRMLSRMLGGKWMCRSHRKTMLLAS